MSNHEKTLIRVSSLDIVSYSFSLAKEVEMVIKSVYILFMGRPDSPRFDAQGAMRRVAEAAEFGRLSPDIAVVAAGVQGHSALLSRILQAADPRHSGLNTGLLAEIATKSNISMPSLLSNLRQERLARGDSREPTAADLRSEAVDRLRQSGFTTESRLEPVQYFFEQLRLLDSIEGLEQLSEPNALRFLQTVWYDATLAQQPGFYMMGHTAADDADGAIKSYHGPVSIYEDVTGQQTPGRRHEPVVRVREMTKTGIPLGRIDEQEKADDAVPVAQDAVLAIRVGQRVSRPVRITDAEREVEPIDNAEITYLLNLASNFKQMKAGGAYNLSSASNLIGRTLGRIIGGDQTLDVQTIERTITEIVEAINPTKNVKGNYKLGLPEMASLIYLLHPRNRDRFTDSASWRRVYEVTREVNKQRQQSNG
jgi:hypothetical protein